MFCLLYSMHAGTAVLPALQSSCQCNTAQVSLFICSNSIRLNIKCNTRHTLYVCMQLGACGPSTSRSQTATSSTTKQLTVMALTMLTLSSSHSFGGTIAGSISSPRSTTTHGRTTLHSQTGLGAAVPINSTSRMLAAKCTEPSSTIACRFWVCPLQ